MSHLFWDVARRPLVYGRRRGGFIFPLVLGIGRLANVEVIRNWKEFIGSGTCSWIYVIIDIPIAEGFYLETESWNTENYELKKKNNEDKSGDGAAIDEEWWIVIICVVCCVWMYWKDGRSTIVNRTKFNQWYKLNPKIQGVIY